MNPTLDLILNRKSVRAYTKTKISPEIKDQIIQAALRSPTAGNMMLYSIIEVTDPEKKDRLSITCDHQPFIAKAPLVLIFLADYQRWVDYFEASGVEDLCKEKGLPRKTPEKGDLFLACCDALIAAQTSVIAAESLGIGSCYIGDIMENYEIHKALFDLPQYVFPITMVCYGYPTAAQKNRPFSTRFDSRYIVFQDKYQKLPENELKQMFELRQKEVFGHRKDIKGAKNFGQHMYQKKYTADFSAEMNRSVNAILDVWLNPKPSQPGA
jgi:nitroreductase